MEQWIDSALEGEIAQQLELADQLNTKAQSMSVDLKKRQDDTNELRALAQTSEIHTLMTRLKPLKRDLKNQLSRAKQDLMKMKLRKQISVGVAKLRRVFKNGK
jgi:hypothetical protein